MRKKQTTSSSSTAVLEAETTGINKNNNIKDFSIKNIYDYLKDSGNKMEAFEFDNHNQAREFSLKVKENISKEGFGAAIKCEATLTTVRISFVE